LRESVIVVLFDLPVENADNRHNYTVFRRKLKENGYLRMQKSVYVKRIANAAAAASEFNTLHFYAPAEGNVLAWSMTVAEFRAIQAIRGESVDFDLLCSPLLFFEDIP
jgi:CRISPR-associated protein Cas2